MEELLAVGIDVYTTLNIQHVESLNDVVAQITRIRVRETVPDSVLNKADDIEVIDLSPEELIQRLREGKVYVPKQAERALNHYFSPGNLTALGNWRSAAPHSAWTSSFDLHARPRHCGAMARGRTLLACVSEDPRSAGLVRYTKRLADRLHAPWTAIYIETRRSQNLPEIERDRIADTLRTAEKLQGEAITIPTGGNVAEDILSYSRANNVTQIVMGKSERTRWFELINGSVVRDIVRHSGNISVHVIAGDHLASEPIPKKSVKTKAPSDHGTFVPLPYLLTVAAVALALGFAYVLKPFIGIESADLVFLVAVIGVAYAYGLWPSMFAAVTSMLVYQFFFLEACPPLFPGAGPRLCHLRFEELLRAHLFLLHGVRRQQPDRQGQGAGVHRAQSRRHDGSALHFFEEACGHRLAGRSALGRGLPDRAFAEDRCGDCAARARRGAAREGRFSARGRSRRGRAWSREVVFREQPAGRERLGHAARRETPLLALAHRLGRGGRHRPGTRPAAGNAAHAGRAAPSRRADGSIGGRHRARAAGRANQRGAAGGGDRAAARGPADLLVPRPQDAVASILGSVTSLKQYRDILETPQRDELVSTIQEEAERLSRFVANLLDMTKIEAGSIELERQPVDIDEVVGAALQRVASMVAHHHVEADLEANLPMLNLDVMLFEQVLVNLLDNAAKYAPPESVITVRARRSFGSIAIEVLDEGPGIPRGPA